MTAFAYLRFDITPKGQLVHIACGPREVESPRHPCFRLESPEALNKLQQRIWEHYQKGDASAPRMADKPGGENSSKKGPVPTFSIPLLVGRIPRLLH
jgi:hypothetical protein